MAAYLGKKHRATLGDMLTWRDITNGDDTMRPPLREGEKDPATTGRPTDCGKVGDGRSD